MVYLDPMSKKLLDGAGSHGPLVLMYHSVLSGSSSPDWPWAVSYERFCQQLDLLVQNGWKTIRVQDLGNSKRYVPKTVVITFDDGYEDNYKAFEALVARGMTATWFVVSNDIGGGSSWVEPGVGSQSILNKETLREFLAEGMEVASHTCSHSRMPQLSNVELVNELNRSKQALEDILGQEIESFAYPYGAHDERCVQAVRDASYKYACTTRTGWALAGGDPLTIRRITVFANDSLASFARKLAFATNDVGFVSLARYYGKRVTQRLSGRG